MVVQRVKRGREREAQNFITSSLPPLYSLNVLGNGLRGLEHQVTVVSALAELLPVRGVHHVSEVGDQEPEAALLEHRSAMSVGKQ